jgi:hypothetical protein
MIKSSGASRSARRLVFPVLPFILLLLSVPLFGEDDEGGGFDFSMSMSLGVETFEDQTFQKIGLTPEFSIGKFGMGLDLILHYTFVAGQMTIRAEDWVAPSFGEVLGLYLSKFRYVRYGFKGEPLFIKFGSIDDGRLGNSFIMGSYANTIFLPERRIFGLSFDIDGALFNFPYVGIETHVGDLSAFDVFGTRLFVRPLIFTGVPIIRDLQVGFTVAADSDPYRYADAADLAAATAEGIDTTAARVMALGGDLRIPIVSSSAVSLVAFSDLVSLSSQNQSGLGGMLGAGGRLISFITYGAQIRFLGDNFIPVYFDSAYDIARVPKYALLEGGTVPGYIGWLASLGTSLLEDSLVLNISVDGPFGALDSDPDNYLNFPHLRGIFTVAEGLIPGFSFDFAYDKTFIRTFGDIVSPEGAVARAQLNYRSGPAVLSFFYLLSFEENDWTSPQITSGLESSIQLF